MRQFGSVSTLPDQEEAWGRSNIRVVSSRWDYCCLVPLGEAVPEEGGTRVEVTDSETPNVDKDTPAGTCTCTCSAIPYQQCYY